MKKKRILIPVIIAVIFLGLVFQDELVQGYVTAANDRLEAYAEKLLENSSIRNDAYGAWDVDVYHEDRMVEFRTGGFGLAPSSTYKGFYYSADNTHKPFSAAYSDAVSMEVDGDRATWTDGTDNHGLSLRITEKWFWYEASF